MAQDASVAVIVLNWNGWHYLEGCLAALANQTYRNFEVIVVDNGSTDGSPALIAGRYPNVRLILNSTNRGFAAANNQAIQATSSTYVATLNNDTTVEPDWLEALVAAGEAHPEAGAIASKMVFAHAPEIINSCGIGLDRAGIAWDLLGGRRVEAATQAREVFGACAGGALYRRMMLDEIGLFDEDFFAYMEDVDLAWRGRLAGWSAVFAPNAVVTHVHSGTLGDASPRKRFLLGRNKLWTIAKCLPRSEFWQLPIILTYELGATVFGVYRRDWAAIAGRLAALAGLPRMLGKRRDLDHGGRRRASSSYYEPLVPPWMVPARYRHLSGSLPIAKKGESSPLSPRLSERLRAALLKGAAWLLTLRLSGRPTRAALAHPLRIVVLRPDHLGDVLLSRPAIELLRRSLPAAELTVVTGPWAAASLQGLDCRVATFPFPGFERRDKRNPLGPYVALVAFAGHLARGRYDAALLLRPDHWWGALACGLVGIPVRVGEAFPLQKDLLTHRLDVGEHEAAPAAALRAARTLIAALGEAPLEIPGELSESVTFVPSATAAVGAQDWLRASAVGRVRVALHPGAGAAVKLWPAHRWSALAEDLAAEGMTLILTGGEGDRAMLDEIQAGMHRELPRASGLSWDQLAALYAELDLVVGVDSGPLHLAAAVGTSTVRIYGPSDPKVYGPAGELDAHRVLASPVPCAPCGNLIAPPCGYTSSPPCLAAIGVSEVVAAIRAGLGVPVPGTRISGSTTG